MATDEEAWRAAARIAREKVREDQGDMPVTNAEVIRAYLDHSVEVARDDGANFIKYLSEYSGTWEETGRRALAIHTRLETLEGVLRSIDSWSQVAQHLKFYLPEDERNEE